MIITKKKSALAGNLRQILSDEGITVAMLAEWSNVSAHTIRGWLYHDRVARKNSTSLKRVADVLRVGVEELRGSRNEGHVCTGMSGRVEAPQYTGKLYFQEDVEVNKNGNNVKLKCHLLPEEQMRDIGFTDCRRDTWFYYRTIHPSMDISFSVSINKADETVFRIDVIDEDFGQPYDYQRILRKDPRHPIALDIKSKAEEEMQKLMALGVVSGHVFDQYI